MNTMTYTFRVIRYVHDPAVGEMLNVGVLLHAPEAHYLGFKFEPLYRRLSNTFVNFDGESYRRYINRVETALRRVAEKIQPSLDLTAPPGDLEAITRLVLPDSGGCFQLGPMLAGITDEPAGELEIIFERMVASQYRQESRTRRTDDDVWTAYQRRLPIEVKRQLKEKTFETQEFETTFPHTFKNGRWHILEPVSMDYVDSGAIQKKAVDWLGNALALDGHPELGKIYLLLGAPQNENFRRRYNQAKVLLHKMPVEHEIIEEDEAADFAEEIAGYMREHGLIPAGEDKDAD